MDPICSNCGEPFFGGLCVWCTCDECGDIIRDGVCLNCNSHTCDQNSFNNSSNIPDFYTPPPPPSFYCYNCGSPSEEGMPCGQCFCDVCGYTDCLCYAPSAHTSYAYDPSFDNYPQNDFTSPNFMQEPNFNGDSFRSSPNFDNCEGSFGNSLYEPDLFRDIFRELAESIKNTKQYLNEYLANRTSPEPHVKSMEELLVEEKAKNPPIFYYDCRDCCPLYGYSAYSSVEPEDSPTMGDEHFSTIPETESSSVENLIPIPREFGEISNGDSEIEDIPAVLESNIDDYADDLPMDNVEVDKVEMFSVSDNDDALSCGDIDYIEEKNVKEFLAVETSDVDDSYLDPEGDITMLNNLLNEDPSPPSPPVDFKLDNEKDNEFFKVESPEPELEESLMSLHDANLNNNDESVLKDTYEIFSNHLSKVDNDFSSSDDESFSDEEVQVYSNSLFEFDDKVTTSFINPLFNERLENVVDEDLVDEPPLHLPHSNNIEDTDTILNISHKLFNEDSNEVVTNSFDFNLLSSRPPAKPPDEDFELNSYKDNRGVVDEIYEQDVPMLDIFPTQPTRASGFDFTIVIRVFHPFFTYPIFSPYVHSIGSEDTIFDPGISIAPGVWSFAFPKDN